MKSIALALILGFAASAAVAAAPAEQKTASGIVITTLKEGSGASPKASDTVRCITAAR